MALSATGTSPSDRDAHLWDEELEKVRACRETMTPAAVAAVESVLRSIRSEQAEDDSLVLYTLSVLEEGGSHKARSGGVGWWGSSGSLRKSEAILRPLGLVRCLRLPGVRRHPEGRYDERVEGRAQDREDGRDRDDCPERVHITTLAQPRHCGIRVNADSGSDGYRPRLSAGGDASVRRATP
jgi:hypothetical protein